MNVFLLDFTDPPRRLHWQQVSHARPRRMLTLSSQEPKPVFRRAVSTAGEQ